MDKPDLVVARHPNDSIHINWVTETAFVKQAACGLDTRLDEFGRPMDPDRPIGAIFDLDDPERPELTCDRCRQILADWTEA